MRNVISISFFFFETHNRMHPKKKTKKKKLKDNTMSIYNNSNFRNEKTDMLDYERHRAIYQSFLLLLSFLFFVCIASIFVAMLFFMFEVYGK